jgi:hypothetical protein
MNGLDVIIELTHAYVGVKVGHGHERSSPPMSYRRLNVVGPGRRSRSPLISPPCSRLSTRSYGSRTSTNTRDTGNSFLQSGDGTVPYSRLSVGSRQLSAELLPPC